MRSRRNWLRALCWGSDSCLPGCREAGASRARVGQGRLSPPQEGFLSLGQLPQRPHLSGCDRAHSQIMAQGGRLRTASSHWWWWFLRCRWVFETYPSPRHLDIPKDLMVSSSQLKRAPGLLLSPWFGRLLWHPLSTFCLPAT